MDFMLHSKLNRIIRYKRGKSLEYNLCVCPQFHPVNGQATELRIDLFFFDPAWNAMKQ